jgi:hypothetical protein
VKVFDNIREWLRQWFLNQALKKSTRKRKMYNYRDARNIGILYDASTEEQYQLLTGVVKDLQQDQKKVKTLGYVQLKKMPDYSFPKLTYEFCNSKSFSWNQKPKLQSINDFINQDYDILIDLSPTGFFHLKYLMAQSPAHFKVGRYADKYVQLYDLMLQVDDNNPLSEVINHTFFYLKLINNDQGDSQ